ncbi:MAG: hypothetical protein ACYDBB_24895 [Armatimonadota bacterium]
MAKDSKGLSRGKRWLLIATGILVVIVLLPTFWWLNLNTNPVVTIPPKQLPSPNAYDFYVKATVAHVSSVKVGNIYTLTNNDMLKLVTKGTPIVLRPLGGPTPGALANGTLPSYRPTLADYDAYVRANAKSLKLLHQGFAYEYGEPVERSYFAVFPHYAKFREMARLLIVKAYVDEQHGRWGEAMDSYLDAQHLGMECPRQGPMIAMLAGWSIKAISRQQSWKTVDRLNAQQARAAARRMDAILMRQVPFADTLTEEKYFGQAIYMELFRKENWRKNMAAEYGEQKQGALIGMYLLNKRKTMTDFTRYLDAAIAQAKQPYALHLPPPPEPTDLMNKIFFPPFEKAFYKFETSATQDVLFTVTLTLRAYYTEHGNYPATLQALTPAYLSKLPDDPFAMKGPLQYKRTGKTYVLYSIGPDGKDNGGTPSKDGIKGSKKGKPSTQSDSTGDMVAGVNGH